jgi:hemerythrin
MIWDNSLSTGHEAIDAEHRILLNCVNDLYDATLESTDAVVAHVFDTLAQYTVNHFRREEDLMRNTYYTYAMLHENEHNLLVNKLDEYRKQYFNGEVGREEFLHFLKLWLVGHIKGCDLKLAEHLKTFR